jgi:TolB-like protein
MKHVRQIVLALMMGIILLLPLHQTSAQQDTTYTVAVLPFSTSGGEEFEPLGKDIAVLLNTYLSTSPALFMVERGDIEKAMDEIAMGMAGTVEPSSAAQIGSLTGAQVLVTGRVFPVRKELFIVAKIIGVETGRVYGESVNLSLQGNIDAASQALANKVAGSIASRGDTLIAKAEKKEDLIAELKQQVAGKSLPTVSVAIVETNIGRDMVDPAAQTEIAYILHALGFRVIDPATSNVRAEIEISGEAFSEFGMRKGNLVSSQGRVELTAVNVKTGEVVNVGRDVAVAVDLSRQMAGKAAIAKAAKKLSKPLVQDIVR